MSYGEVDCPPFPTRRCTALFAYLVANRPRAVERAHLAGVLWPQVAEAAARRNLNTELWRLRQALGPAAEAVRADSSSIRFDPPGPVDVDFERILAVGPDTPIEELTRLAESSPLEFLSGHYDDWVIGLQERLRGRYLHGLERLLAIRREQGALQEAIACGRRLLAHDPLREEVHRELMRLHAAVGDRAAAIRQYRQCVEVLSHELGVPPMPDTEAAYRRVLLGPPEAESFAASPSLPEAIFVGRGKELDGLRSAWDDSARGQGRVVLVTGEAGIGKTRLIEEWMAGLGEPAIALRARCSEVDDGTPYLPVADILRSALKPPLLSRLQTLSRVWLGEIARLVPEALDLWPDLPANPPLPPEQAQERLQAVLAGTLAGLASPGRPLLLFVDDLHWADPATLDVLGRLVNGVGSRPLMLLGSYRPEAIALDPDHPLNSWLSAIGAADSRIIHLAPLSSEETAEWLWRLGGTAQPPERFAERIFLETEGHPLFVLETLRELFDSGLLSANADGAWSIPLHRHADDLSRLPLPAGVRDVIRARVSRLRAEHRDFLTLAAVIGRRFDLPLLRSASGQEEARVIDSLADLLRSRLIRQIPGGASFDFSHDKIREVIHQGLDPSHRRHLHEKVGRALENLADSRPDDPIEALAYHFARSDDLPRAVRYLRQAAERAKGLFAYRSAIVHFERARSIARHNGLLSPGERFGLTMECCRVATALGSHASLPAMLGEAAALARELPDECGSAEVELARGLNCISQGEWERARALLEQVLDVAVRAGDLRLEAGARIGLGDILTHASQTDEAVAHYARVAAIGDRLQDVQLSGQGRMGTIHALPRGEQPAIVLDVLARALEHGAWELIISMASDVVIVLLAAGRLGDAIVEGERLLGLARQHGVVSLERSLLRALSRARIDVGDFETARALALESVRACRVSGYRYGEMRAMACQALAEAGMGAVEDAVAGLQRVMDMAEAMGAWQDLSVFKYQACEAMLYAPRWEKLERAWQLAEESRRSADRLQFARARMVARSYLSEIERRRGNLDEACRLSSEVLALMEAEGHADGYEPLIWFTHYRVRRDLGDPQAGLYRRWARALLAERARAISHRDLRRSYLCRVPLHGQIRAAEA